MSMWSRHGIFTHPAWTPPPLCSPALQRPEGWKLHLSDSLAWGCLFQTYCRSVSKLCPTLCNRMNCSTPGFPELRYLLEFAQTHVHWVNDAIQPSHPLLSPSPLTSIFPSIRVFSNESALHIEWPEYWISASTSVLSMNTQDWSSLGQTSWSPLQSKKLSKVFSNTTIKKYQFFGAQLSL